MSGTDISGTDYISSSGSSGDIIATTEFITTQSILFIFNEPYLISKWCFLREVSDIPSTTLIPPIIFFNYDSSLTPFISSLSPEFGNNGEKLNITGSRFGSVQGNTG